MKKQRTWKQYRAIDLAMFGIILVICEFIIVMAARFWFPGQPYTVSLAGAIASIMYMRWGYWGGIHAALAGLVFCPVAGWRYFIPEIMSFPILALTVLTVKAKRDEVQAGVLTGHGNK